MPGRKGGEYEKANVIYALDILNYFRNQHRQKYLNSLLQVRTTNLKCDEAVKLLRSVYKGISGDNL